MVVVIFEVQVVPACFSPTHHDSKREAFCVKPFRRMTDAYLFFDSLTEMFSCFIWM